MTVVDIYNQNEKLVERVDVNDLTFNPRKDSLAMLDYAQEIVYEDAFYTYMDEKIKNGVIDDDKSSLREMADNYAMKEKEYAQWRIKEIEDSI